MANEINWESGYTSKYYVRIVDPYSFGDREKIDITSGSIDINSTDSLLQSASFDCETFNNDSEKWIRIYVDAYQNGNVSHIPLFTGLASSQKTDIDSATTTQNVQCYSVLKPADDILLDIGWYAPKGRDGTDIIKNLLSVINAPIVIEPTADKPILKKHILAENGETNLSMVMAILDEIQWRLTIDGSGTIELSSIDYDPVRTIDHLKDDIIETKISIENDWFDCPNVIRVTSSEDTMAIYKDYDPLSKYSIVNRNREIWIEEDCSSLSENDTLTDYARRKLMEKQNAMTKLSYSRRFIPNIDVTDVIRLHYPKQGIEGDYRIVSQSISLDYSIKVSEKVEEV